MRLPVTGPPIKVAAADGELPSWTPQGDGLYYRNGRRCYWAPLADAEDEPFGTPQLFLTGDFVQVAGAEHAVSADGSRLLLLHAAGRPSTQALDFVVGWSADLEARTSREER